MCVKSAAKKVIKLPKTTSNIAVPVIKFTAIQPTKSPIELSIKNNGKSVRHSPILICIAPDATGKARRDKQA
jgi:hypothetical protein